MKKEYKIELTKKELEQAIYHIESDIQDLDDKFYWDEHSIEEEKLSKGALYKLKKLLNRNMESNLL